MTETIPKPPPSQVDIPLNEEEELLAKENEEREEDSRRDSNMIYTLTHTHIRTHTLHYFKPGTELDLKRVQQSA